MSIIIFIIILAILIFVHELGHFLIAKLSGIRVDEFALGFPPTLLKKKVGETTYALNLIPFGGYVKIHGENPDEDSTNGPDMSRSMNNKPKRVQAFVLVAGIIFNVVFAWILITASLASGLPTAVQGDINPAYIKNNKVIIAEVVKDSPAEKAGIMSGDVLVGQNKVTDVQNTIQNSNGSKVQIIVLRGTETKTFVLQPSRTNANAPYVVGIAMNEVGLYQVPFYVAPYEGLKLTYKSMRDIVIGLKDLAVNSVRGKADFSQVTGPVGIVGLVGEASSYGFVYLLGFTALISLNLAVINLLPFPALDGGRLLFVLIEAIKGSPIKPKIANTVNAIGFSILILLMVVVTYKDIIKLIHP